METEKRIRVSPAATACMEGHLTRLYVPPALEALALREAIAGKFGVASECVAVGSGSTELMNILAKVKYEPGAEVIISSPSFILYPHLAKLYGYRSIAVPMVAYNHDLETIKESVGANTRIIFLDTPMNISGRTVDETAFSEFIDGLPAYVIVVYDNVYGEYQDVSSDKVIRQFIVADAPVVVCRSFSKAHALFGLRVGYMLGRADVMENIRRHIMPYGLGTLAQCAALASLQDDQNLQTNIMLNRQAKETIYSFLSGLGVPYVPTNSNALLINFGSEIHAIEQFLSERGVRVRGEAKCELPGHLQVFLIDPVSIEPFVEVISEYYKGGRHEQ